MHCFASLSRSVAFVLAYIMKSQKVSAAEASRIMKPKWDAVWPADAFIHQLLEYEGELLRLSTLAEVREVPQGSDPKDVMCQILTQTPPLL